MTKAFGAVVALTLAFVGLASASSTAETYKLSAKLNARAEVPKPAAVPAGATGQFTGTAVELANDKARITWKLTFSHLSGKAIAAHIHSGKVGKAGPVLVALCGPCRSAQRGTATITHRQFAALETGRTYVNVHTPKNANGEIRGQVKSTETESGGSSDPAPPPSEPSPPAPNPYP
jgi:hypothetical protein